MDNKRHCPNCGAANDGFFEFCYKCGSSLNPHQNSKYSQPFNSFNGGYYEPATIAGQPTEAVKAYVGQRNENDYKITRKLIDMEISGSSTHWCWPVFLLAMLGPMFAAVWFFYRKMPKIGALVALAGILISGADVLLHLEYEVAFMREIFKMVASSESFTQFLERMGEDALTLPAQNSIGALLSSLIDLVSFAGSVLISMFAIGIYRSHIVKELSAKPYLKENYFSLMRAGGTSIAWALIAGGILWIITNLVSNLSFFVVLATL